MTAEKRLAIVAWLFIVGGSISLLSALTSGKIQLGTGLLTIPAGIGLLHRRSGWRTYALVVLWIAVLLLPLILVLNQGSTEVDLEFFGKHSRTRSTWIVISAVATCLALAMWQIWTLMQPSVRRLFEGERAADA